MGVRRGPQLSPVLGDDPNQTFRAGRASGEPFSQSRQGKSAFGRLHSEARPCRAGMTWMRDGARVSGLMLTESGRFRRFKSAGQAV